MGQALTFAARYSATDLNKVGGQILDTAASAGIVEISRRGQEFVLLLKSDLDGMLEDARENRPRTLDDLLRDYDADKIKKLTSGFLNDLPSGKESL